MNTTSIVILVVAGLLLIASFIDRHRAIKVAVLAAQRAVSNEQGNVMLNFRVALCEIRELTGIVYKNETPSRQPDFSDCGFVLDPKTDAWYITGKSSGLFYRADMVGATPDSSKSRGGAGTLTIWYQSNVGSVMGHRTIDLKTPITAEDRDVIRAVIVGKRDHHGALSAN